jgi:glycosyltransferase involved in cell wall biosynthesis
MRRVASIGEIALGVHHAHAINVIKTTGGMERIGLNVTLLCREPVPAFATVPASSHTAPTPPEDAADLAADAAERAIARALASYAEPTLRAEAFTAECPSPGAPSTNAHTDTPTDPDAASARFAAWAARRAIARRVDAVYARHFHAALACAELGIPTILETHAHKGDPRPILDQCFAATRKHVGKGHAARGLAAIVTINESLRAHYISRGACPTRVHVVPDGVDTAHFARPASASPHPAAQLLDGPGPHALYAGTLAQYKGIPTILACAVVRPHVTFHLLGGSREEQAHARLLATTLNLTNVRVHGRIPHADVPHALWAADALLLPPSAKDPSAEWTSPVKLGEYLAAQRPIIASRIPGLVAWADDSVVRWFEPDDATDMARALDEALAESPAATVTRNLRALVLADRFSYSNRARRIMSLALPDLHSDPHSDLHTNPHADLLADRRSA